MNIITIIVIFRKNPHLKECQTSLKNSILNGVRNQVIIIDNTHENLGFTGGNNKGIQQALRKSIDAVLLLNDDTKIDRYAILELTKKLEEDPSIGIVVPKIYFYPGYEFHKNRYRDSQKGRVLWYAGGEIDWDNILGIHDGVDEVDHGQYDVSRDIEFATGCCALIRRDIFDKIGFFDERYFLYLEDLDFSVRTRNAGFKIVYEPKAVIWHKNAQSSESGSALHDYFFTRNRLLFGMTYAKLRTKFALLREAMKFLIQGPVWRRRAIVDFFAGKFAQGSWRTNPPMAA